MRGFVKSLIGALVGFLLFAVLSQAVTWGYYRFVPATWFLNYYYARADNAVIGQPVALTLCRHKHYQDIDLAATRTFIYSVSGQGTQAAPIREYTFNAHIENLTKPCTTVQLKTSQQPQKAGTYVIHTEAEFFVHGDRKTISYDTPPYVVGETTQSVQQQIKQLQTEIQVLEKQLSQLAPHSSSSSLAALSAPSSGSSGTQPTLSGSTAPAGSPARQTPSGSATTPAPKQQGIVGQTIAPIITGLQQTINGLGL